MPQAHEVAWFAAFGLTLAWAAWRGGREERLMVVVLLLADLAATFHQHAMRPHRVDPVSWSLDLMLLAFIAARAAVTTRWWPLYACAAQLAVCIGLVATALELRPLVRAYVTFSELWSYAIIGALGVGTALEQAQVRADRRGDELGGR